MSDMENPKLDHENMETDEKETGQQQIPRGNLKFINFQSSLQVHSSCSGVGQQTFKEQDQDPSHCSPEASSGCTGIQGDLGGIPQGGEFSPDRKGLPAGNTGSQWNTSDIYDNNLQESSGMQEDDIIDTIQKAIIPILSVIPDYKMNRVALAGLYKNVKDKFDGIGLEMTKRLEQKDEEIECLKTRQMERNISTGKEIAERENLLQHQKVEFEQYTDKLRQKIAELEKRMRNDDTDDIDSRKKEKKTPGNEVEQKCMSHSDQGYDERITQLEVELKEKKECLQNVEEKMKQELKEKDDQIKIIEMDVRRCKESFDKANFKNLDEINQLTMKINSLSQKLKEKDTQLGNINELYSQQMEQQMEHEKKKMDDYVTRMRIEYDKKCKDYIQQNEQLETQKRIQDIKFVDLREELQTANDEKNKALNRLSQIAGARLTQGNPNIADLSDQNRPTKLAEKYSELYDNEWTDTYEELEANGLNEIEAIGKLLAILKESFYFCHKTASHYWQNMQQAVTDPFHGKQTDMSQDSEVQFQQQGASFQSQSQNNQSHSQHHHSLAQGDQSQFQSNKTDQSKSQHDQCWEEADQPKSKQTLRQLPDLPIEYSKQLHDIRKTMAVDLTQVVQEEFIRQLKKNDPAVAGMEKGIFFIKKCVELCWLMGIQDPPLCLVFECPAGSRFNKDLFRAYTKGGKHVDYPVWPAMLLKENGSVLAKGVAQGCA